ncbi:ABC transporter ATP-binding protein [Thalassospira alkalitolerans]|uniref:ABC transporter ATP-binding protein n=1 Tax=Thalassospira alkalitolerans TaxID=1293890 RepID=UPI003C6F13F2|tara:strand:- start:126172 stop:127761 length:1590 start_codon:yes stop_codon:yes gene_type:complete
MEMTKGAKPAQLEVRGVTKAFPGCLANDDISFRIEPGEIHALLGENGAGKSTLVKIIYGVLQADQGELLWDGKPVKIHSPHDAREMGVGLVFQHFSLFETMTVLENIALAMNDVRDMAALRQQVVEVEKTYGLPLDPDRHVYTLSVGERQRIEIVRCLLQNPKLLILDEPTSVLTPQEVEKLFETLRRLADEGCAILYISHKLHEVKSLCQRATVLRGGKVVGGCDPRAETAKSMAEMMIGQKLTAPDRSGTRNFGDVRLDVSSLSLISDEQFGTDLKGIDLKVRGGEIMGVAGVAGNGQNELFQALAGEIEILGTPDCIRIDDKPVAHFGPRRRRRLGAAFVPEERNGHGAVPDMSLSENAFLTAFRRMALSARGLISEVPTRSFADNIIKTFDVRTTGASAEAGSLSGGNLQKFIVGREILQDPGVLVISQPTWGVDAGAASAIHQALLDLAAKGTAVLVISQDLDEIFAICDQVVVMSEGKMSIPRPMAEVSIEEIGLLMGGLHDHEGDALQMAPAHIEGGRVDQA